MFVCSSENCYLDIFLPLLSYRFKTTIKILKKNNSKLLLKQRFHVICFDCFVIYKKKSDINSLMQLKQRGGVGNEYSEPSPWVSKICDFRGFSGLNGHGCKALISSQGKIFVKKYLASWFMCVEVLAFSPLHSSQRRSRSSTWKFCEISSSKSTAVFALTPSDKLFADL